MSPVINILQWYGTFFSMLNKYLYIRELQIKPALRYHDIPIRMAQIQETDVIKCWWGRGAKWEAEWWSYMCLTYNTLIFSSVFYYIISSPICSDQHWKNRCSFNMNPFEYFTQMDFKKKMLSHEHTKSKQNFLNLFWRLYGCNNSIMNRDRGL